MNPNRRMQREAVDATLQFRNRQETLAVEELIEEKLAHLQMFIDHLTSTPHGSAEIERRIKRFGECKRSEDETSGQYYGRLRHWLDRNIAAGRG